MNLFSQSLKFQGFPFQVAKTELHRLQRLSLTEFKAWQEQQKWNIFKFQCHHNPIYRAFLPTQLPSRWEDIPILTKTSIQLPIEQRLSKGFTRKNTYVNNTSGSTGTPFFFAKDKFTHAMTWALILDRFGRHGIEYGKSLQARFFGIPLSRKGYWKEKTKDFIAARERFPVFDLSDEILGKYMYRFEKRPFEYINGYTSSLVLFAKFLIKRNVVLKQLCPSLKVCMTTSEMCNEIDRQILKRGFGIPVVNEYGAAELDLIAFEDEDYDWIISSENLFIEIVDDHGVPVPDGTEGRIIVTSLYNKAMPFIRYQLGDICAIKPERKGIHPVLQSLQGRINDVAQLPSGKKSPGLTFYYISKNLFEGGGFMKEFIIRQTTSDSFHYEYVAERELNSDEKAKVQTMMDKYLEPGLKASFERKLVIERTKAGKLKHFQSDIPLQD